MNKRCPYCEYDRNSPIMSNWDILIRIKNHYLQCDYGRNFNDHIKFPLKYCPMCGRRF